MPQGTRSWPPATGHLGRCNHARLHDRTKDSCQFVWGEDPDGHDVETLDGQAFLAVNGVQTLSQSTASMAYQIGALAEAGVNSLRLSLQIFARAMPSVRMASLTGLP